MTATHTITKQYGRRKDRYLELIQRFPLKPIRTEDENEAALVVCKELMMENKLSDAESDYLDVLVGLVEVFEEIHYPMGEDIPDGDMLSELLTNRELTQMKFAKEVGIANSTISEIIKGKREFTRKQLEKVSAYFKVPTDLFRSRPKRSSS